MPNPTASASPDVRRSIRTYLDRLERERFYGVVAVRYENGNPVHIRREESILPTNLPRTENPNNVSQSK